jgi:hypothetical protein
LLVHGGDGGVTLLLLTTIGSAGSYACPYYA